jgi:hypothetical protein
MSVLDLWWAGHPAERYWLEVGDRGPDLGVDLNAPTRNERGQPFWSYDLLREVRERDFVLHYDRSERAIIAWSRAVGRAWPDDVVWAARGTSAREQNIRPHERPGLRVSLEGPYWLQRPLTLAGIRAMQPALVSVRADRPYFPFELGSRETRPMQGYLFKLPVAFLELFPELHEVLRIGLAAPERRRRTGVTQVLPVRPSERPEFVPRNEAVRSREARPWARDPSEVDRALATHARIERLVAEAAVAEGWRARAYGRGDPVFDLLLERTDGAAPTVVVEVKSLTATNEEKQLRLALGQVLRYRQLLQAAEVEVVAFVALERPPGDSAWLDLCASVGVRLVWPATVRAALASLT